MRLSSSEPIRRPADTDMSDLTAAKRDGDPEWVDGDLVIPFSPEPTPDEQAAIRLRLLTRDAAHEAQVAAMQGVLAAIAGKSDPLSTGLRLLLNAQLDSTLGGTL